MKNFVALAITLALTSAACTSSDDGSGAGDGSGDSTADDGTDGIGDPSARAGEVELCIASARALCRMMLTCADEEGEERPFPDDATCLAVYQPICETPTYASCDADEHFDGAAAARCIGEIDQLLGRNAIQCTDFVFAAGTPNGEYTGACGTECVPD